jgi:YhcH/YjgK/YiaL family protein
VLVDKIDNISLYNYLPKNIKNSLLFLQKTDFLVIPDGKYEIDRSNIFYIVQRYDTKPFAEGKLETHKKYIDIQFIVTGEEILGYTPFDTDNLQIIKPYDASKDICFYQKPEELSAVKLSQNMFCLLYPQAAHMPGKYFAASSNVLKVVVKILI